VSSLRRATQADLDPDAADLGYNRQVGPLEKNDTLISFLTARPGDKGVGKKDSQADKSNLSGLLATLSKFRGRLLYKRKRKRPQTT
jgi:hypothetical protein